MLLIFQDLIREIKLSQARRGIYYVLRESVDKVEVVSVKGKAIAKRYLSHKAFLQEQLQGFISLPVDELLDASKCKFTDRKIGKKYERIVTDLNGDPIYANPRAAGTPRMLRINGQDLYSGNVSKHVRAKLMTEIKKYFAVQLMTQDTNKLPRLEEGYTVNFEFHAHIGLGNWDIQNRAYPYEKALLDLLVTGKVDANTKVIEPILGEDNVHWIKKVSSTFRPLTNKDDAPYLFVFFLEH